MNYIVYGIECPRSGRILYVGKTSNLKNRIATHLNIYSNITWWLNEIKSEGLCPVFKVLCRTDTNEMSCIIEKQLIDYYSKLYCILNKNNNKNYRLSKHIHGKSNI